ncbi:MAG: hypothetical protein ACI9G6_000644, partial [Limisphaerales bacterium]
LSPVPLDTRPERAGLKQEHLGYNSCLLRTNYGSIPSELKEL